MRLLARSSAVGLGLVALHASRGSAHPLHTTLAELGYDAARREITVSLRVFADDFSSAVERSARVRPVAGRPLADLAMYRYVVRRFVLADAAGRVVPLAGCGARRAGEMLFLCLRGPAQSPPSGMRLRNALLMEAFDDQVNIVQHQAGASRRTTLFTARDGVKALP